MTRWAITYTAPGGGRGTSFPEIVEADDVAHMSGALVFTNDGDHISAFQGEPAARRRTVLIVAAGIWAEVEADNTPQVPTQDTPAMGDEYTDRYPHA